MTSSAESCVGAVAGGVWSRCQCGGARETKGLNRPYQHVLRALLGQPEQLRRPTAHTQSQRTSSCKNTQRTRENKGWGGGHRADSSRQPDPTNKPQGGAVTAVMLHDSPCLLAQQRRSTVPLCDFSRPAAATAAAAALCRLHRRRQLRRLEGALHLGRDSREIVRVHYSTRGGRGRMYYSSRGAVADVL